MNTAKATFSTRVLRFLASPAGRALIALVLVLLLGCIFNADGAFFKTGTHRATLRQVSVFGILACGMTLVIITGGIDLAVGSLVGLTAVCFAILLVQWEWPWWAAVLGSLAVGSACGGVSGTLTARLKIQPFIATLAMMVFARGAAKWACDNKKVALMVEVEPGEWSELGIVELINSSISDGLLLTIQILIACGVVAGNVWMTVKWWRQLRTVNDARGTTLRFVLSVILLGIAGAAVIAAVQFLRVSMVTVILMVCAAGAWIALARHRWGRELYAIGGNEEAARLSGVPVARSKILAYVASGGLAAVAGICQASQETLGDPEAGQAFELKAIAIVVIGGTNLMGGRGGIGLTLFGMLTIGYLEKILSINNASEHAKLMLTGAIIVAAVLMQRRKS